MQSIRICRAANIPTTLVVLGINSTLDLENIVQLFDIAHEFKCYLRINIFRPNNSQNIDPPNYVNLKHTIKWILENKRLYPCRSLFSALVFDRPKPDYSGINSLRILPDVLLLHQLIYNEEMEKSYIKAHSN